MIIFPDIEKIIVAYLNESLIAIGETGVNVSVMKSKNDNQKEVVVTAAYGNKQTPVHKSASLVLDIYAPTYEDANALGLKIDMLIRECTVSGIKKSDVVLGPVRTAEASQSEKRSISVDLIVIASDN